MKRRYLLVLCLAWSGCTPAPDDNALVDEHEEVAAAAEAFLSYTHAFDYAAMRANATPDFEIIIFGRRLTLDEFIGLLREMEETREGQPMNDYDLTGLNTRIVGDVAYTSWEAPNWLEFVLFVRSGDQWLMDRAVSVRREEAP